MTANASSLENSSMRYLNFRDTGIMIRRGYPGSYACEISSHNKGEVSFANACSFDESSELHFLHPEVYMQTSNLTMHQDDCSKVTGTGILKILYICPLTGEILFQDRHKITYSESTSEKVKGTAITIKGEPLTKPINLFNYNLLPEIDQLLIKSTRIKLTHVRSNKISGAEEHFQCDSQTTAKRSTLKKVEKVVKTLTREYPLTVTYSRSDKAFNLINAFCDPTTSQSRYCFDDGTYNYIEMSLNPVSVNIDGTNKTKRVFKGFVKLITSKNNALSATRIYPITFCNVSNTALQSIDSKELPKGMSFQIPLPACENPSSSESEYEVV